MFLDDLKISFFRTFERNDRFMRVFDTVFRTFELFSAKLTNCRTHFAGFLENLPHFWVIFPHFYFLNCGNFVICHISDTIYSILL